MAELADALDLGSSGRPCRFKSCYPQAKSPEKSGLFLFRVAFRVAYCFKMRIGNCIHLNFLV